MLVCELNVLDATPGQAVRTPLPIRVFERREMVTGEEPLTSSATFREITCLASFESASGMNCLIGAETSNVKDEPRRERARLVLN